MSNIAFIGLGEMGSRMAGRLLGAGHQVRVLQPYPRPGRRVSRRRGRSLWFAQGGR